MSEIDSKKKRLKVTLPLFGISAAIIRISWEVQWSPVSTIFWHYFVFTVLLLWQYFVTMMSHLWHHFFNMMSLFWHYFVSVPFTSLALFFLYDVTSLAVFCLCHVTFWHYFFTMVQTMKSPKGLSWKISPRAISRVLRLTLQGRFQGQTWGKKPEGPLAPKVFGFGTSWGTTFTMLPPRLFQIILLFCNPEVVNGLLLQPM